MFSARKIGKSTSIQGPFQTNSTKRFKTTFNDQDSDLCNRSFHTAQNLLERSEKNLRQTKLCLVKKKISVNNENHGSTRKELPGTSKRNTATVEFTLMPVPKEKSNALKMPLQGLNDGNQMKHYNDQSKSICNDEIRQPESKSNLMEKNGRNKRIIMGKVDFCLKTHKLYPNLNVLWDVYGKIVKILTGNNRGEHILLLRTANDRGPVIQSIYYDFNNTLESFSPGLCVRAIGEFMNENRLRTFQLEKYDCEKYESAFSRIQSVTSFALVQENI